MILSVIMDLLSTSRRIIRYKKGFGHINGDYFPDRYFLDNYDEPLYFKTIEEAAKSVSQIVGHEVAATVEAIEEALYDYEEDHEDEDVFYSFHVFEISES